MVDALAFARAHSLAVSVRGGGHNIAGTALVDGGVTIDMSLLREVAVDPGGGRRPSSPAASWATSTAPRRSTGSPRRSGSSPRSARLV